jgi:Fe2+ or Zn2+ uptake regulation protein
MQHEQELERLAERSSARVVCRICRTTAEVPRGPGPLVYPASSQAAGFAVDWVEVTFRGVCACCQLTGVDRAAPVCHVGS